MTTKKDAVRRWQNTFSNIPTPLVARAYEYGDEGLELLAGGIPHCTYCGAESEEDKPEGKPCEYCDGNEDGEYEYRPVYGWPAAWGWMFQPNDSLDEDWIRDNPELAAQAGFLVYDCDEAGILLGVDEAGYSFLEEHWTPLYDLRGLKWHDEEKQNG